MTKITLELIENSIQRTNPLKDRELDLKGNKISLIENLGTTLDQFDALDFTDNEIHRFDGFPCLKRLKSINFTNNKIIKIAKGLNEFIPNIDTLVFINNNIHELKEVDNLLCFKNLEFLAFLKNPITTQQNYRLYVIHKLPQVRILDFCRVKDKERRQAATVFANVKSTESSSMATAGTNVPMKPKTQIINGNVPKQLHVESNHQMEVEPANPIMRKPTIADMQALRTAIQNACSNDEVDALNYLLNTGKFAGFAESQQQQQHRHYRN